MRIILLALGLVAVLTGLVAHRTWQPLHNAAVVGIVGWPILVWLIGGGVARLLRLPGVAGMAMIAMLPLLVFAGPAALLATSLLLAASLAVGSLFTAGVGSSRVDLQACKLEYSIVSPK